MSASRIILAGGSGFLGQGLAAYFDARHYDVTILTRSADAKPAHGQAVRWDPGALGDWAATFEGAAAVVNLAGRSINCRLTAANRREIVRSRVESVRAVANAIRGCRQPPAVYVQLSATGIYGDAGDTPCSEATPPGTGFLAETCRQWEDAFQQSPTPGVRRVLLRLGVVLGRDGGVLPTLVRLTRWLLGGAAGSGRQYVSWLHVQDAVRIVFDAVERHGASGTYVAASPAPVTNAALMRHLRTALHRPWSPPAPAFAVRMAAAGLGFNAELALSGQRCTPRRLLDEGFAFEFPELQPALADLIDR